MGTAKGYIVVAREWMVNHGIATLVLTLFVGATLGAAAASGGGEDTSGLSAQLSSAEKGLGAAEKDLATSQEQAAALESDNEQLRSRLDALTLENDTLTKKIVRLNAKRELPSLLGAKVAQARLLESRYGWNVKIKYEYSAEPAGTILGHSPAGGTMMSYGAPLTVVVAKAIPKVPDLTGLAKGRASSRGEGAGWDVVVVEQISTSKPGTVIAMSPAAGSPLVPGGTITLTVAKKAPPPPPAPEPEPEVDAVAGCTPGYSPCLPPASDYDCSGGPGDGPEYTGYVEVTGSDPYGLDSDNDGSGCES